MLDVGVSTELPGGWVPSGDGRRVRSPGVQRWPCVVFGGCLTVGPVTPTSAGLFQLGQEPVQEAVLVAWEIARPLAWLGRQDTLLAQACCLASVPSVLAVPPGGLWPGPPGEQGLQDPCHCPALPRPDSSRGPQREKAWTPRCSCSCLPHGCLGPVPAQPGAIS